ncbi:hypothetical protein [Paraburkholderia caribensis]|jgi:hypothetical protein|uniref:hypothetical protein n=1 Tax=Paraburkholderia caribensis TaxID=75105 RepID=UPI0011DF5754|nr:hypothetical protein [Paraburkholderia caribensis]
MNKQYMFLVAHPSARTDEHVAVVQESNDVVVAADNDAREMTLQDIHSFQSLQRAMNILERLVTERADAVEEQRARITDVLNHLRLVH